MSVWQFFLGPFCEKCLLILGIFGTVFSVFLVFFALYNFVSHLTNSVSLESETSDTNLVFRYFASLIFAFVSLRFASKRNEGTPYLHTHILYKIASSSTWCFSSSLVKLARQLSELDK